jgi:hypothetical protein
VESDGRLSGNGDRQPPDDDNVIRLPREWVGPREELVPIGPAARARARAEGLLDPDSTDAPLSPPGRPGEFEPGRRSPSAALLPPTAHDFWGEDSAALHDVIQGPAVAVPPAAASPAAPWRRSIHRPHLRPAVLIGARRASPRAWTVTGTIAVVALLAVLASVTGGGNSARPRSRSAVASLRISPPTDLIAGSDRASLVAGAAAAMARTRAADRSSRITRAHRRIAASSRTPTALRHRHATRSATPSDHRPVPVSVTTAVPTYTSPAATSTTPATTPPAPATATSSGVSASTSTHQSSSPSQPAFGANGTLGPGSSPDS